MAARFAHSLLAEDDGYRPSEWATTDATEPTDIVGEPTSSSRGRHSRSNRSPLGDMLDRLGRAIKRRFHKVCRGVVGSFNTAFQHRLPHHPPSRSTIHPRILDSATTTKSG